MKWICSLIIFFCTTSFSIAGDYNSGKLGEGAGAYLYAVCVANELKNTKCSYLAPQTISLQPIINDIEYHLKQKDLIDFRSFLNKDMKSLQSDAKKYLYEFIDVSTRTRQIDIHTACGMLFQNVSLTLGKAEQQWRQAKELYSDKR